MPSTSDDRQNETTSGRDHKAASSAKSSAAAGATATPHAAPPRERIVLALMQLAAERRWDEIGIPEIARQAQVSLADFRDLFPSKGAVLGGFARMIDRQVLEGGSADMAQEPARERLFDVFMRRLDAMAPHKQALQRIARAVRGDLLAMAALHGVALNSQRFMLAEAGIDTEGPLGRLRLEGAVVVFARTMETWFHDDDPGLARTLARLDTELTRGERMLRLAGHAYKASAPFRAFGCALMKGPSGRHRDNTARDADRERTRDDTITPAQAAAATEA